MRRRRGGCDMYCRMNSVLKIRPRSRLARQKRFLVVKPASRFSTAKDQGVITETIQAS
jgi:hypothetical protein